MKNNIVAKKTESEVIAQFVDEYCIDNDGERAARAIGVRPAESLMRSKRLLAREEVQDAITIRKDEIKREAAVSPDWVLTELKYQYKQARGDNDRSSAIKTLEMLAKHVGLFSDKDKNGGNVTVIVQNYADVKID